MKRKFCLFLTILLFIITADATKRALIIGIGDYPVENGWSKINGDKDIPLVEATLLRNGFDSKHITKLKNEQATYLAICKEFEHLISQTTPKDTIYIHFSGHGQRITDLNGDEIKDNKDEAWIPYDAHIAFKPGIYEGEKHLVDDQINEYLHRLRQNVGADGKIIVIADACHSGDSTRSEEEENSSNSCIRGTCKDFSISNIKNTIKRIFSFFSPEDSITTQANINSPQNLPLEWIFISACQDYQTNQEYNGVGSLTTVLYNEKDFFTKITLESLSVKLENFYLENNYIQRPKIECPNGIKNNIFL